jgi:hypothetical protein
MRGFWMVFRYACERNWFMPVNRFCQKESVTTGKNLPRPEGGAGPGSRDQTRVRKYSMVPISPLAREIRGSQSRS